jgi:hypothetical protein
MSDSNPPNNATNANPLLPELPLYQGLFYAFDASGGFHLAEGIAKVDLAAQADLELFDLTNCVQVMMDVRLFNQKLGIMKDVTSNTAILNRDGSTNWMYPYTTLNTSYDPRSQVFADSLGNQVDTVSVNAQEFAFDISNGGNMSILSVGVLATLYDDFDDYVKQYFGYAGGFASLFESAGTFEISEGFNENKLYSLITDSSNTGSWGTDANGDPVFTNVSSAGQFRYNADISGSISINNIVKSLRFVVDSDIFGNRHPLGLESVVQNPAGVYNVTVVDICSNEAVENKFYINDIQQPTIGLTQSGVSVYNYRFRQTVASYAVHPLQFVDSVNGSDLSALSGVAVTLSNETVNGIDYQYIDLSFTDATGMDATAVQGGTGQFYYRCSAHIGMGGTIVNHGVFDNPVADSSDPSGNAYIKAQSAGVVDPSYQYNFGVGDGFLANDLIFVREGIRMKVEIKIDQEAFMPINNIGPLNTTALKTSQQTTFQNFATDASNNIVLGGVQNNVSPGIEGTFSLEDEVLRTSITRTVQVPLVIRLANMHNGANAYYTNTLSKFQ